MSWQFTARGEGRSIVRGLGAFALLAFAVGDVLLIGLALRHSRSTPAHDVVSINNNPPPVTTSGTSPTPTPSVVSAATVSSVVVVSGAKSTVVASYGSCTSGYAVVADKHVPGAGRALALTATSGPAVMFAQDNACTSKFFTLRSGDWQALTLTAPGSVAGATSRALWVIGTTDGLVLDSTGKVLAHPKSPCRTDPSGVTPTYVAALSDKSAALFCTKGAASNGQVRIVYTTTNSGNTWTEYAGARQLGSASKGRKDGLDGDGQLVSVAGIGGQSVAVVLADSGCKGLQLRYSNDAGHNWKVGGCLPSSVPTQDVALGGTGNRIVVAAAVSGHVKTYSSANHGKNWSSA